MTRISNSITWLLGTLATLALTACGGNGSADIGGTISGLQSGATVVLQNNGADNLSLTGNGSFTFSNGLSSSTAYNVTVLTQPSGSTCTVAGGSGTTDANGDSVSSVVVTCVASSSITGTISGLPSGYGLSITANGTAYLIPSNGSWAVPGVLLTNGATYTVTYAPGQSSTVGGVTCPLPNNASGTIPLSPSAPVVTLTIVCQ